MSALSSTVLFLFGALVQSVFSQCSSRAAVSAPGYGAPYAWPEPGLVASAIPYDGLGVAARACDVIYPAIASALEFTPTSGGALAVTSSSAIPPTGISLVSENAYEGALAVAGELPFVGTATIEGEVPSAGVGAINHACGDGITAMISETSAFVPEAAITTAAALGPIAAGLAPAAAALTPASPFSPVNRFTPSSGLGLGNRYGFNGCGGRGLMY